MMQTPHNLHPELSILRDRFAETAMTVLMQHHYQTHPDEDINPTFIATQCWFMANAMINMRDNI